MRGRVVLLMGLIGCAGRYEQTAPACGEEGVGIVGLSGTFRRAMQSDGTFDDDPPGDLIVKRSGAWDPSGGDLSYTDRFIDNYVGSERSFEGFGTVYGNGDLDLEGTLRTVWATGEEVYDQRLLQVACDVENTLRRSDGTVAWFENGSYRNQRYDFTLERLQSGAIAEGTGVVRASGAWTIAESWRIGEVAHNWTRSSEGDGFEETVFEVRSADRFADGLVLVRPGGSTAWTFSATDGRTTGDWDLSLGVGGQGGGTVTYTPLLGSEEVCEVTVGAEACEVQSACEDAPRPPCWTVVLDGTDRSSPCCAP